MKKRIFKLILFLLCSLLLFNTTLYRVDFKTFVSPKSHVSVYEPKAFSGVGALTLGGGGFSSIGVGAGELAEIAGTLSISAPVVAGVLTAAVLAGVIFVNRESIYNFLTNYFDDNVIGEDSRVCEDESGDTATITPDNVRTIRDNASSLLTPLPNVHLFDGTITNDNILKLSFPSTLPIVLKVAFSDSVSMETVRNYYMKGLVSAGSLDLPSFKMISFTDRTCYILINVIDNVYRILSSCSIYSAQQNFMNDSMAWHQANVTPTEMDIVPYYDVSIPISVDVLPLELPQANTDGNVAIPVQPVTVNDAIPIDDYVGDTAQENISQNYANPPADTPSDDGILSFLKDILNKILSALAGISFISSIKDFCSTIAQTVANIWDWCGNLVSSLGDVIGSCLDTALGGIEDGVKTIGNTLSNLWDWCGSVASAVGSAVGSAVSGLFQDVIGGVKAIGETLVNVWDWCGSVASAIGSAVGYALGSVLGNILSAVESIGTFLESVFVPSGDVALDFTPLNVFTQKFPFSIPWDFYDSFKMFNVTETPLVHATGDIDVGGVLTIPSIELDFSTIPHMDILIKITKFFELIAFSMFLIFVTRKFI